MSERSTKRPRSETTSATADNPGFTSAITEIAFPCGASFRLIKESLRKNCKYFDKYPESSFPDRFELVEVGDKQHSYRLLSAPSTPTLSSDEIRSPTASLMAFKMLFAIISHTPFKVYGGTSLGVPVAKLAVKLQCGSAVKEAVMDTAFKSTQFHLRTTENSSCEEALEMAYHLQNETIFRKLVPRVVEASNNLKHRLKLMPEVIQYIIQMEWDIHWGHIGEVMGEVSILVGQIQESETFLSLPNPGCSWLLEEYQRIWTDDDLYDQYVHILRLLGQSIQAGMLQNLEKFEPLVGLVQKLKSTISDCFVVSESGILCIKQFYRPFKGTLPWDLTV